MDEDREERKQQRAVQYNTSHSRGRLARSLLRHTWLTPGYLVRALAQWHFRPTRIDYVMYIRPYLCASLRQLCYRYRLHEEALLSSVAVSAIALLRRRNRAFVGVLLSRTELTCVPCAHCVSAHELSAHEPRGSCIVRGETVSVKLAGGHLS